jgi:hypothetical protein
MYEVCKILYLDALRRVGALEAEALFSAQACTSRRRYQLEIQMLLEETPCHVLVSRHTCAKFGIDVTNGVADLGPTKCGEMRSPTDLLCRYNKCAVRSRRGDHQYPTLKRVLIAPLKTPNPRHCRISSHSPAGCSIFSSGNHSHLSIAIRSRD